MKITYHIDRYDFDGLTGKCRPCSSWEEFLRQIREEVDRDEADEIEITARIIKRER